MAKHKHHDAIIAYANGEEIEWRTNNSDNWCRIERPSFEDNFQYRLAKKRTIVGRFSFPAPETCKPCIGAPYYIAAVGMTNDVDCYTWADDVFDNKYFAAGRLHLTWEGAAEHLAALEAVSLGNWQ